jgi:hypothetical protein
MKRISIFILVLWLSAVAAAAQDKITLRGGETYTGTIVLQNDEILMFQIKDGTRFQFPVSQILKIERAGEESEKKSENDELDESNISGMAEIWGGGAVAHDKFSRANFGGISLSFGTKKIAGKPIFVGAGAGVQMAFLSADNETLLQLPLFVRLKTNLEKSKLSPFFMLDAGYAFALNENCKGGLHAKLSAGMQLPLSSKSLFFAGVFSSVSGFYGNLTETVNGSRFSYAGNSIIAGFGVNAGIQF